MYQYMRFIIFWQRNPLCGSISYLTLNQLHIRRVNCPSLRTNWFVHHRPQQVTVGLLQALRPFHTPSIWANLWNTLNRFLGYRNPFVFCVIQYTRFRTFFKRFCRFCF